MNIYLHELWAYRKNTLVWILSLCAGTLFLFSMFPAFADNADAMAELLKGYPDLIKQAFGLSMEQIGSIPGFYSFIITFLTLCGAVQAMTLGISVLSKETTGKTADFLLTKPVRRARVAAAKLLAVFTCAALTSGVFLGAATAMAAAVARSSFDYTPFLLMSLSFFFVQLIFLSLGFCFAAIVPKIRSVLPVSLSIVFGFFALGAVAATLNEKGLYYLSPFKYFDTLHILQFSSYETSFALMGAAVTAAAVAAGFAVFVRRDVRA